MNLQSISGVSYISIQQFVNKSNVSHTKKECDYAVLVRCNFSVVLQQAN